MRRLVLRVAAILFGLGTLSGGDVPVVQAWPYVLDCPCRKYRTLTERIAQKAEEAADYYAMAKGVWDRPRTAEEIKVMMELAVEAQRSMLAIQQQRAKLPALCTKHKHAAATCPKSNHR